MDTLERDENQQLLDQRPVIILTSAHYAASKGGIRTLTYETIQAILKHMPAVRFGKLGEMGEVVAFLVLDESSYITGTTFNINGGYDILTVSK